jgi:hypothetical protein
LHPSTIQTYSSIIQINTMSSTNIPLPSEGVSGGKDSTTATATCYCGAVQLLFV